MIETYLNSETENLKKSSFYLPIKIYLQRDIKFTETFRLDFIIKTK